MEKSFLYSYICTGNEAKEKFKDMLIDLNTISKEDFANELLLSEDCSEFYYEHEEKILNLSFDFEELKEKFEQWMIENCDSIF